MGGEVKIPLPTHTQMAEQRNTIENLVGIRKNLFTGTLPTDWEVLYESEPDKKTIIREISLTNRHADTGSKVYLKVVGTGGTVEWDADDPSPVLLKLYPEAYLILPATIAAQAGIVYELNTILEPGALLVGKAENSASIDIVVSGSEVSNV